MFSFLLIIVCATVCATRFPQSKLHNFMDEDELKFYFGSEHSLPEYEIVNLPENLESGRESVINGDISEDDSRYMNFRAFGTQVQLNLHPNKNLISPYARIVRKTKNSTLRILDDNEPPQFCHFIHVGSSSSAAISNCVSKEIHGLVFLEDLTLEILPLSSRLKFVFNLRESISESKNGIQITKIPHLVKRSTFVNETFGDDFLSSRFTFKSLGRKQRGVLYNQPNVELALFFDEAFYTFFAPFYDDDQEKLRNFILSYVNSMQSLYYHPSLGRKVDFTIVYLELMQEQPHDLPHAYGERNALIDNFCHYQMTLNPSDDRNPEHWDMAIYVSGLDFFAWDSNGSKNGATMGLATVGGVCNDEYNCVIAEFGSINQFGRPYPSAGFTAVYILAHEIGHNLGMSHDSAGNSCSKDGFVMSPSRGSQGETTWSHCSASVIRKLDWAKCLDDKPSTPANGLDPWKYSGYPGISYTAKEQCEILLRDREAYTFVNGQQSTVCDNLHCRTPNQSGFFFAGPALQGTDCGNGKWCEGGSCINRKKLTAVSTTTTMTTTTSRPQAPNLGPWQTSRCKSDCIKYSKGFQLKRRQCSSIQNRACDGLSLSVEICDDRAICRTRKSVMEYGTQKCKEFSTKVGTVDPSGHGLQASYDNLRLWMPCAIFCRRKNTTSYFTPRVEVNQVGLNPYYPDGTFCHRTGAINYYCIQNHCLPENTMFTKSMKLWIGNSTDVDDLVFSKQTGVNPVT